MFATLALLALLQAPAASPAAAASAATSPVVVLETSMGKIRLGLRPDKAPISVENFLQYVRAGHYDGTLFHRVIPTFMIQGGGLTPDMKEKAAGKPIKNESKNGLRNKKYTLAMARLPDPHSATAQFFINVRDNAMLDYGVAQDGWGYAVFGEVVEGTDVVDKIKMVPTTRKGFHENVPIKPVTIDKAYVEGEAAAKPAPAPRPEAKPTAKP